MLNVYNLRAGDVIDFTLAQSGISGDRYQGMVFQSVVPYSVAKVIDPTIITKHSNFYPFIKNKIDEVDDPDAYPYIIVNYDGKTEQNLVFGLPWIAEDTLTSVQSRIGNIVISNYREIMKEPLLDVLNQIGAIYTFELKNK